MFTGNRRYVFKVCGLAAAVIIGSLAIYAATIPYGQALRQEAENKAEIHSRSAEYRIEQFCSSQKAEEECVTNTRQTENENRRNEEDLGAQKLSAWWAQVMAVAALVGMGLSAVGVWLVKTTFDETQKANEIAREAMERQLRAYVSIDCVYCFFAPPPRTENPEVKCFPIIRNSGVTPALNLVTCALITAQGMIKGERIWETRFSETPQRIGLLSTNATGEFVDNECVSRINFLGETEHTALVEGDSITVCVRTEYDDIFGKRLFVQSLFASRWQGDEQVAGNHKWVHFEHSTGFDRYGECRKPFSHNMEESASILSVTRRSAIKNAALCD
jgi:hypothetical protein